MNEIPHFPVAQVQSKGRAEFERQLRHFLSKLPIECEVADDDDFSANLFRLFNEMIGCSEFHYDAGEDQFVLASECDPNHEHVLTGTHCGKLFEKNEPVYSCRNCSMDPTCVLCARCFEATDHSGHDVRIHLHTSGYGCCDCGDDEAFKVPLNCAYHNAAFHRSYAEVSDGLPDSIKLWLAPFIDTVLDFCIDVFRCSSDSLFDTPTVASIREDEAEIDQIWGPARTRLYTLMLWNDESHAFHQVIELCQKAVKCSDQVANEITACIDRVGRQPLLSDPAISTLISKALVFASAGLGVTIRTSRITDLEELACHCLHYLALLADKDLERYRQGCFSAFFLETLSMALVRPCADPEAEHFVQVDLSSANYFVTDTYEEGPVASASFFASRASLDRSVAVLMAPHLLHRQEAPLLDGGGPFHPAKSCLGVPRARLDWIFQLDSQLWKSVRLELQGLFTRSLLSLPRFKTAAAAHYAVNYPFYSRETQFRNPEPDTSLISYAVQLFTAPSIALLLATELNFISYLLSVLEREMVGQMSAPEAYHSSAPAQTFKCQEDLDTHCMLRSILRDLDFFLDFPAVRQHVSSDLSLVFQALHFISSFQHFFPNRRKTGDHVAYQDQRFKVAIESAFHILDIVESLADSFHGQPSALVHAIHHTTRKITGCIAQRPPGLHSVPTYFGSFLDIPQCDVASQPMSYYHPLHWMLACLLADVASLTPQQLAAHGHADLYGLLASGVGSEEFAQQRLQMLFDAPIQAFALSAQVRANLWVRNGLGALTEEFYFRTSPKTFLDHCLFLAQHMFCLLPPEVVLATLVDRYGLGAWFFLAEASPFDVAQQVSLTEDMLLLIIHCVGERGRLLGESVEEEARRIIVQNAFLPTTFSKLQEVLPPHIAQLPQLNALLAELCTFKPPDTLADSGSYTLKHEYHRLLSTHHYLHTRNRIDHAVEFKKKAAADPHWFIPSLRTLPSHSPFNSLTRILHAPFMAGILFYTLHRAVATPEARSTLIDYVLQIFIVAAAEEFCGDQTLWELVSTCPFRVPYSDDYSTLAASLISLAEAGVGDDKEEKLIFVLNVIAQRGKRENHNQVAEFLLRYQASSESRVQEQEKEKRRALAKARRAQLMKDMNSAQDSFVEHHSELYNATDQVEGELVVAEEEAASPGHLPYLTGSCILCQEECGSDSPYAIPCLVQSSALLAHQHPDLMDLSHLLRDNLPQASPDSNLVKTGSHISSCGHLIHLECLRLKVEADLGNDIFLQGLLRRFHFDPPRDWYSCPLCHSLNNAVMPVQGNPGLAHPIAHGPVNFPDWLRNFIAEHPTPNAQHPDSASEILSNEPASSSCAPASPGSYTRNSESSFHFPSGIHVPGTLLNNSIDQSDLHPDTKTAYKTLIDARLKATLSPQHRPFYLEYGSPSTGLDSLLYSLCYTIAMIEISDRSTLDVASMPHVFDRISTITQDTLVMVWNTILSIHATNQGSLAPLLSKHCLHRWYQLASPSAPSPITEEPFQMLVEFSLLDLPSPRVEILGLVQLLFLLQFVRATVCLVHASTNGNSFCIPLSQAPPHAAKLVHVIYEAAVPAEEGYFPSDAQSISRCYSYIQRHLVVFLRKTTLLFKALQLPLLRPNPTGNELEDLLAALSLPDSESIFQNACSDETQKLCLTAWCQEGLPELANNLMLEFPLPYSLASLEERMDSMYAPCDEALAQVCQAASNNPALCLLCQKVICASPICCSKSRPDAWDTHASQCGGDVGVFLVPKEARIFLKYGGMKMSKQAPYLDIHGQAAKYSHREGSSSLPLYLSHKRYRALLKAVLDHQIPHQLNREKS